MAERIKLSNEQKIGIYESYQQGAHVKSLAKSHGCSVTKIYQIIESVKIALNIAENSNSKKRDLASCEESIVDFSEAKKRKQA